jgi:transposase-like protein
VKPEGAQNQRNGYSKKTVLGEEGAVEIAVPRDRAGSFEKENMSIIADPVDLASAPS